ncbi:MAG: hypothetical protein F6K09_15140 [Merismopedia sp. SIO2A8]|nr:hypothetical protein [Merismopedia sp. SIO2A8]
MGPPELSSTGPCYPVGDRAASVDPPVEFGHTNIKSKTIVTIAVEGSLP